MCLASDDNNRAWVGLRSRPELLLVDLASGLKTKFEMPEVVSSVFAADDILVCELRGFYLWNIIAFDVEDLLEVEFWQTKSQHQSKFLLVSLESGNESGGRGCAFPASLPRYSVPVPLPPEEPRRRERPTKHLALPARGRTDLGQVDSRRHKENCF